MKKFVAFFALLLFCSGIARAQNTITVQLRGGVNTLQLNQIPSTTQINYQLNFPENTQSFSIVAQPHTSVNLTSSVQISLFVANNTALNSSASNTNSFAMACLIGGGGSGLPVNVSLSSFQVLLGNTVNSAGTAVCPVPSTLGAILQIVGGGNGGASYDLFVNVSNTPMLWNCAPSVSSSACSLQLIAGKTIPGNTQPLLIDNSGFLGVDIVAQATGIDGVGNSVGMPQSTSGSTPSSMLVAPLLFNGLNWDRPVKCPTVVPITLAAASTQQLVAPIAGNKVRVCSLLIDLSTAGTWQITEGTGATCGTGTTNVSGLLTGNTTNYYQFSSPTSFLQTNVAGDGLCIVTTTAVLAGFATVEQH